MNNNYNQPAKDRQLLIFGVEASPILVQTQCSLLQKEADGTKERALKTIVVEQGTQWYKLFQVKQGDFTVILIGLDGTEKYRCNEVLAADKLFALIDGMPMRKAEINSKHHQKE